MRTWLEIDLKAISHNIIEAKKNLSKDTKLLAVVKADAYGHGAIKVAQMALETGIDYLAVATIDEAVELRNANITAPILVLGLATYDDINRILEYDITITLFNKEFAKMLSQKAEKMNKTAKIHIKIDTGMSRIGYVPNDDVKENIIEEIIEISKMKNLLIEGIFSHFSKADEYNEDYTNLQFERFVNICNLLESKGLYIKLKHICNSAGIIKYKKYHLDMVRLGIALYGHYPSNIFDENDIFLKSCMTFKTTVVNVKTVPKDVLVGYGGTYKSDKEMKVATIAVGYADGYSRLLSNKSEVMVNGTRCKIIGNVCMDLAMIDVTNLKNIKFGDEVILFGKSGNNNITIEEIADIIGTINYEVLCSIGKRVPRIYV